MDLKTLTSLADAQSAGIAVVRAIPMAGGAERLLYRGGAPSALAMAADAAIAQDRSQTTNVDGQDWFLQVFNPPVHLIVVGAVHIAQSLATMARTLEWNVTLIDPRTSFASEERFPGLTLLTDWPDDALVKLGIGPRTAIVTLTHDQKLDDPALMAALKFGCFYVGALGSRKTHAARRERLLTAGFAATDIDRIHGPVGLDIGALSPSEIAVAILAQIIDVLRGNANP